MYKGTKLEHLSTPFDHPVEVDGKIMNVNVQGDGDKCVVILPGRGVTAPAYDFAPLIAQLKDTYTVYAIDYFGSGLSDMTDIPRTIEQVAKEVHEALTKLGVQEYVVVAHSISGIVGLYYANIYPDEIKAFIGIDTATPKMDHFITAELIQKTTEQPRNSKKPHNIIEDFEDVVGYEYSAKEIETMQELHDRNSKNDEKFEEMKTSELANGRKNKPYDSMVFPGDITTIFFLSSESVGFAPDWYEREHRKQLTKKLESAVRVLEGGHFLHHSQASKIAQSIKTIW